MELSKKHWREIRKILYSIGGVHGTVLNVLKSVLIKELKRQLVPIKLMNSMGYATKGESTLTTQNQRYESQDMMTLHLIVASILKKLFDTFDFNNDEMQQIYDVIHCCFDPLEVSINRPTAHNKNNTNTNAPWIR